MRRTKLFTRCFSFLMTLTIVFSNIPLESFAATDSDSSIEETKPLEEEKQVKLESLLIHSGSTLSDETVYLKNEDDSYSTELIFDPDVYEYSISTALNDTTKQLKFRARASEEDATVTLNYDGGSKKVTWKEGEGSKWANFLVGGKNEFTLVVSSSDPETESTTYNFSLGVNPTITSLTLEGAYLKKSFNALTFEYTATVPAASQNITFQATPKNADYEITYNGDTSGTVDISEIDQVEIIVSKDDCSNTYIINLEKQASSTFKVNAVPSDAAVAVYDHKNNAVAANDDGSYTGLFNDYDYTYVVSKTGYITVSGNVPNEGGEIDVVLQKTTENLLEDVDAYWKNFRGSDSNMAITDVRTPQNEDADNVAVKWVKALGSGWSEAPSVPIIADDTLVVMSGQTIYKLDLQTGEVLAKNTMAGSPSYSYTPPTYGAGMIFCPLGSGTIQAFNADTLESLWVYKDSLSGQALSPITYSDGYIYTGFWYGEEKNTNFVCIDVTDEYPDHTNEVKFATWKHTQKGGFYWAGSVAIGDAIIVGTDDGANDTTGTSYLYAFDKKNGEIISKLELSGAGDQRSSIAYDSSSGRIYFTTKGGYLYCADVNASTGKISNLKYVKNQGQSTSTPVVYKGRVYYAIGNGISNSGSSGSIVVADADTLKTLFTVKLKGYPQCSLLLSTAYESKTGYLYLYATYNNKPGGISVIRVKSDCRTEKDAKLTELYDAKGYENYCVASIICGEDGTLYYKNDSCVVFAIGVPSIVNVEKLINEIGTVTLDSEGAISAARASYDALSTADQKNVSNYSTLVAAEKAYQKLLKNSKNEIIDNTNTNDAQAVETVKAMIEAIGEVTLYSKAKINRARTAYDALTIAQKKLVTNYETLVSAEEKLEALNVENAKATYDKLLAESKLNKTTTAKTTATAVKRSVSGNTLTTSNAGIINLDSLSTDLYNEIMAYEDLLEEEKEDLDQEMYIEELKGLLKERNQVDDRTGISVSGCEWNVQLIIEDVKDFAEIQTIKEKINDHELLAVWDIYLQDMATGEKVLPEDQVMVKIPLEQLGNYTAYDGLLIIHYTENGTAEYLNCTVLGDCIAFCATEFSNYAVAGYHGVSPIEGLMTGTLGGEEAANLSWVPGVIGGGCGIALLAALLLLMKKNKKSMDKRV